MSTWNVLHLCVAAASGVLGHGVGVEASQEDDADDDDASNRFGGGGGGGGDVGGEMIGATGSRHVTARRRSSLAVASSVAGSAHHSLLSASYLGQLSERDEDEAVRRSQAVTRRRAVDTSDLRSCALVQTKMKTWKHYPE